jgi:hypothetical protein
MAGIVPLTIQTGVRSSSNSVIVIGSNYLSLKAAVQNVYWAVIVDRTNLTVVENFTFSDNQNVPPQLVPYSTNDQYIFILTTQGLTSANLPAGKLYQFLIQEGAGVQLKKLEQVYAALNCGSWGWMGYALVSVFDTRGSFEFAEYYQHAMLSTLQLVPVQIGSGVLYTPGNLS